VPQLSSGPSSIARLDDSCISLHAGQLGDASGASESSSIEGESPGRVLSWLFMTLYRQHTDMRVVLWCPHTSEGIHLADRVCAS